MKVPDIVKSFLFKSRIKEFIEDNNFNSLYTAATIFFTRSTDIGALTQVLYAAGINPLLYMNTIPDGFLFRSDISSFSIPPHIKHIGGLAFSESYLRELSIPQGVETVSSYAVESCPRLQKLTIPSTLQAVDMTSFRNNNTLTEVIFRGTVEQWNALPLSSAFSRDNEEYITVTCSDAALMLDPVGKTVVEGM